MKPNLITLQLATAEDAATLAGMSAEYIEHDLPHTWTAVRIQQCIRDRETAVLIARTAHRVGGFAIMRFNEHSAHLNLLAVDEALRRRGLGRQLLHWLHESAMVAGTFTINLELRAQNHVARAFYLSLGYRECGVVRDYYCNREDAIRMARDLDVSKRPA